MAEQKEATRAKRNRERAVEAPGNDAPAADDARTALHLAVGDRVVYASHGIGRVESRDHHQSGGEMVVLLFENGLKVTLPFDRAQNSLRSLSGESELEEVQLTLGGNSPSAKLEHWSRRHRNAQAKLAVGSVSGLAEIVRDGAQRERARVKLSFEVWRQKPRQKPAAMPWDYSLRKRPTAEP